MKGDQNFIDDARKLYRTEGNVVMVSKEENMIIYGDYGFYDKGRGISKVYGHSYVAKIGDDKDTLFLSADTLVSIEHKNPKMKRLLAYKNVRIFKTDLQGRADSLAYFNADSTLFFYNKPVLWTNDNQMTADSIRILLKDKSVHKIYMTGNSFVVSEDSLKNFNQIKGRKMTANFNGKQIGNVVVEGNGESIYYALEQKLQKIDSVSAKKYSVTAGMNKIICSNMRINFVKGKVDNISFYVKPDASFIPPHELKEEDKRLRGFIWRKSERPNRKSVVQR
jgi:lipopolysaccharide export system protein LptA